MEELQQLTDVWLVLQRTQWLWRRTSSASGLPFRLPDTMQPKRERFVAAQRAQGGAAEPFLRRLSASLAAN